MELSFGEARRGVGGGIRQLSNLIHWMAIQSPLVVVEWEGEVVSESGGG